MKKLALVPAVAALGLLAITTADAHVPKVAADCKGLHVELVDYEPGTVVTIVAGSVTEKHTFSGSYRQSFALPDSGSWSVTVDNRGDGKRDQWDQSFTDRNPVCSKPTTTTPKVDVDLTPPTTIPWVPLVTTTQPPAVEVLDSPPIERPAPKPIIIRHTG